MTLSGPQWILLGVLCQWQHHVLTVRMRELRIDDIQRVSPELVFELTASCLQMLGLLWATLCHGAPKGGHVTVARSLNLLRLNEVICNLGGFPPTAGRFCPWSGRARRAVGA